MSTPNQPETEHSADHDTDHDADRDADRAERRLATVEVVAAVTPIPDADAIESAQVRGWTVVVAKGDVAVGDKVVYFEIDSFLPFTDARFEFLRPRGHKTVDETVGHVLRTIRLRGVYSQGLVLPVATFPERPDAEPGTDVTTELGITKWEPPVPAELSGTVLGPYVREAAVKTDAERAQNLDDERWHVLATHPVGWIATEKVDGTSATYFQSPTGLRVSGRNWEYERSATNTLWRIADEFDLAGRLEPGMAVQGEVFGEGIQANPLKIRGQRLAVFAVHRDGRPLPRTDWPQWATELAAPTYPLAFPGSPAEAITQVDGLESLITAGRQAEGVVWHTVDGTTFRELDGRGQFKAINNRFLARQK